MPRLTASKSSLHARLLCGALAFVMLTSPVSPNALSGAEPETVGASPGAAKKARPAPAPAAADRRGEHREGELLVRFRTDAAEREIDALVAARGARRAPQLRGESRIERLQLAPGQNPEALAAELRNSPAVELAEPNFLIARDQVAPNDPRFNEQWGLRNTGAAGGQAGADIGATAAWAWTTGAPSTVVAVVDSGVDFTHPDLRNNVWANGRERANGRDDDRDGFTDDLYGWDWVTDSNVVRDEQGHGTNVAGLIAAQGNNGVGTSGLMWRASLMSLRVLDSAGNGNIADAVEAIDYAVAHGAQVINCSWGTDADSAALRDAIARAGQHGVVVVCSAGNDGRNIDAAPYYPAAYELPNLVAVAATDSFDQLPSWSNWGAGRVTVAAPGVGLLTTRAGGDYLAVTGTSAAAPLVSGVAGLVKTLSPRLGAADAKAVIVQGARHVTGLVGIVSAGGVANAAGALNALSTAGGGSNDNGGNGNGQGNNWHPPVPHPTPGRGTGGRGPGGSFDVTPPEQTAGAPGPGLPDLNATRGRQPSQPASSAPIHADVCLASDPECSGTSAGGRVPSGSDPYVATARTQPQNQTGRGGPMTAAADEQAEVNLGSRNYNWALPLVSLPGRAGLDLHLTLYYNSLVWTRDASTNEMAYNADQGIPGPGFRLGLPVVQQQYTDWRSGFISYLLLTPSGGRTGLRRVGTTNVYEAADGSYAQLTDNGGGNLVVRLSDGTQLTFEPAGDMQYHCTKIKDRNGNYISATYHTQYPKAGLLNTITDTLGRVVTFNYNPADNNLDTITQSWGGGVTHQWAKFYYGSVLVNPNFPGLDVFGPVNTNITVLTRVDLGDGSYYGFDYQNPWGIANRFTRYAPDSTALQYTAYNIPAANDPQTDCPRFTERHDWARQWNVQNGAEAEAVTYYNVADGVTWTMPDGTQLTGTRTQVTTPDGTVYKTYAKSGGWEQGLPQLEETWAAGATGPNRRAATAWTQDNPNAGYQVNPRPTEINIYDDAGNRRRTTISYNSVVVGATTCHLPESVRELGGANFDQTLRRAYTAYKWDDAYTGRRIIGLPFQRIAYDGESTVASKIEYHYDWGDARHFTPQTTAVQHDNNEYGTGLVYGRGNVTGVKRYNANAPDDDAQAWWVALPGYNAVGAVVVTRDALHDTSISYADSFSDTDPNRGTTLAYPTTVTDADNYASTAQYNFYTGAVTRQQDPKGAYRTLTYDSAGRLERVTNGINGAYERWVYWPDGLQVQSYETIRSVAEEAYRNTVFDGAGRVRAVAAENANSVGGFVGQYLSYDVLGRVVERTNPTEMSASWAAAGDDAAGWVKTLQAYDYKGRPALTTYPGGNTTELTYGGCGCAGGEVTTARDERGRRRRYTKDALGRLVKVEELNWDQSVYATTTYTYNARDQITNINQAGQPRVLEYDGYGRLWKETTPEQGLTEYGYNNDDTISWVRDARLVKTNVGYNNRHLVTSLSYDLTGVLPNQNVAPTAGVTFGYDAAGNRTSMTDGLDSASYHYDTLSRLDSETRTFTGLGAYTLNYEYNPAGELKKLTNSWSTARVNYVYNRTGRVTDVTGTNDSGLPTYAGVGNYASGLQYRAFGALKGLTYGNGRTLTLSYDNRLGLTAWRVPNVLGWEYSYTDYYNANTGQVLFARNTVSSTAGGGRDDTLDRSYDYDQVGRLIVAHTGYEARLHMNRQQAGDPVTYGPYSQSYAYDQWGNLTQRQGWGGWNASVSYSYRNNRNTALGYDAAGNMTSDPQALQYDAASRQVSAVFAQNGWNIQQGYDGDGQRARKTDGGVVTYYLRSAVLGGQVVGELNGGGGWTRGYVYLGGQMLAMQQGAGNSVNWVHQDPVTKSQRITDINGTVVSTIDLDPWGGETTKSSNQAFAPHRYTTYERDGNGRDQAGARQYHGWFSRFDQPDPYRGSYDLTNPQSFNRYAYVQNDPVNFTDPAGLAPRQWARAYEGGPTVEALAGMIQYLMGLPKNAEIIPFSWVTGMDLNGGWINGGDLQELEVNPNALKADIGKLLSDKKCAVFVSALLNAVARPSNPLVSTNILDVFDQVNGQGGYHFTPVMMIPTQKEGLQEASGLSPGSIGNNTATVYMASPTSRYDFTITGLHETIHHAGRNHYSDSQLAGAASAVTGRSWDSTKQSASDFWDGALMEHCKPPEGW